MITLANYINGKFEVPFSGKYIDNYDPSTGKVFSLIPDSDEKDVAKAVEAAEVAFPIWSTMSAEERSAILIRVSEGIKNRMDEFIQAESQDNGKPISVAAAVDIPRSISNFHFFATGIIRIIWKEWV